MERSKVSEALKRTVDPAHTKEANAFLDSVQKIIGFAPLVLEVVMDGAEEPSTRQAGVIYLKNLTQRAWEDSEDEKAFHIHEQDRHLIRQRLLEAITLAPEPIKIQLAAMVTTIVKADFPGRWPEILGQISLALDTQEPVVWAGALLAFYRLVKVYEYKKASERGPLTEAMKLLLPVLYQRMQSLMPNPSAESVYLQKMILKILYALVQFSLNFQMLSMGEFGAWLVLVKEVVDREVPPETLSVDEEERPELIWWKAKKWAMHLLARVFERYGSPGNVEGKYKEFAEIYLAQYAEGAIQTALKTAFRKRDGEYVSPRVLNQALCYLENAVSHAACWKWIRGRFDELMLGVVFPLLCHSEADEEMWDEDPAEYIKAKYDIFEDLVSPSSSAASFLSAAMKRKGQLKKTLDFVAQVFNNSATTSRQLDGGLHILGVLAPNLLKKKLYKKGMETMLLTYVVPLSAAEQDKFLRARAMWVVQCLSEAPFSSEGLGTVVDAVCRCLLKETELPIQTEAAVAVQMLLADQAKAEALFRPRICEVVQALMRLLRSVENEDLTTVMDRLLSTYPTEITPIAVETAQSLASLFQDIVSSDSMEDRSVAAMGILGTLESVIQVMEDHKDIMLHLENIVLQVIKVVFEGTYMGMRYFYEEIMSLIESLTTSGVSAPMWEVFEHLAKMFRLEGMDFFMDMMPCLHNYLTVDTAGLVGGAGRVECLLEMGTAVLVAGEAEGTGWGEDAEAHAAKLLECIVLQCGPQVHHLLPQILAIALRRLQHSIDTSELRTMLLQVLVAGLHSSPPIALKALTDSGPDVLPNFLAQWLSDSDCFFGIHDRKLSILGLCRLLSLGPGQRPALSDELGKKILPSLVLLFEGLEKAYKAEAEMQHAETVSGSSEEEDEGAEDGLDSDEDEVDQEGQAYLQRLQRAENGGGGDSGRATGDQADDSDDDDSDADWDFDENDLEIYDTPLDKEGAEDEYIVFKETLGRLAEAEPQLHSALWEPLSEAQRKELAKVLQLADQRQAARTSKAIESGGGYDFSANAHVPNAFNFSSP